MLLLLIPIGIFLLDNTVKDHIDKTKECGEKHEYCKGRIIINKVYNKGAMLNLGEDKQEFVAGVSVGISAMVFLGYLYLLGKKGYGLLKVGTAFLLGGAASNIYDRVVKKKVVDYVSFKTKFEKLSKIVFNISDFFIFIGSALILLWGILSKDN